MKKMINKNFIKILVIVIIVICFISACRSEVKQEEKTKISHGILLEEKENCLKYNENDKCEEKSLVLKVKVKQSYSNKATINQNYFNVGNYIRKNKDKSFDKISYRAVTDDTTDGSEFKVISFDVEKNVIKKLKDNSFADNQLGDYVTDLWINPELKD